MEVECLDQQNFRLSRSGKTVKDSRKIQVIQTLRQCFFTEAFMLASTFKIAVLFYRCGCVHRNGNEDGIKLQEQVTETICSRKVRKPFPRNFMYILLIYV